MTLTPQFKFHNDREWRFDFAFPDIYVAIEIQGFGPGHNSPQGIENDYNKHNEALRYGWIIIYLINKDINDMPNTVAYIKRIIQDRKDRVIRPTPSKINQFSTLIEQARSKLING